MSKFTFTSESVTEGHPDKVCDAISDAIVDSLLHEDKDSHIACETLATKNLVVVIDEIYFESEPESSIVTELEIEASDEIDVVAIAVTGTASASIILGLVLLICYFDGKYRRRS